MFAKLIEAAADGDKRAQRILNWIGWAYFAVLILFAAFVFFAIYEFGIILDVSG